MTERIDALTVILERPVRIDEIAPLAKAIGQMRCVLEVVPVIREVPATAIAEMRVRQELQQRVMQVLEPPMFGWPMEAGQIDGAIPI